MGKGAREKLEYKGNTKIKRKVGSKGESVGEYGIVGVGGFGWPRVPNLMERSGGQDRRGDVTI